MLVQTIEYFFYLIFKAPNKCYAWIHFTWLIGMHNVITVPGQKWLHNIIICLFLFKFIK